MRCIRCLSNELLLNGTYIILFLTALTTVFFNTWNNESIYFEAYASMK